MAAMLDGRERVAPAAEPGADPTAEKQTNRGQRTGRAQAESQHGQGAAQARMPDATAFSSAA